MGHLVMKMIIPGPEEANFKWSDQEVGVVMGVVRVYVSYIMQLLNSVVTLSCLTT